MASGLIVLPCMPALDRNGNPVEGALLYFYENETTTPKDVYSNEALTTPLPNPVVADSAGVFPSIYADPEELYSAACFSPAGVMLPSASFSFVQAVTDNSNGIYYTAPGTGAVTRPVSAKLGETVSAGDFGLSPTNTPAANATAMQAAADALMALGGGTLLIPAGRYSKSGTTAFGRAPGDLGMINLDGQGMTATVIDQTDGVPAFSYNGAGGSPGVESYLSVRNLTVLGVGLAGSMGFTGTLISYTRFERVMVQGMYDAFKISDMDQSIFSNCIVRFNRRGITLYKDPATAPNGTCCNNIVLISCTIGSCSEYGFLNTGGSSTTFLGGDIGYNGSTTGSTANYGLKVEQSCTQGGNAVTVLGVYFEGNTGISDVMLEQTDIGISYIDATYVLIGNTFNRPNSASYSTNCIRTNFGTVAQVGTQILKVSGNGFKGYGTYVPNAGRPYIAFAGIAANATNFFQDANVFQSSVERPAIADQGNATWTRVSNSGNVSCPNGADTAIPLDTTVTSFSWDGSFSAGGLVFATPGVYAISGATSFTTSVAGVKAIYIRKNGVIIGGGERDSAIDNIIASAVEPFAAGDVMTVSCLNNSGSNITFAGTASHFTVAKVN